MNPGGKFLYLQKCPMFVMSHPCPSILSLKKCFKNVPIEYMDLFNDASEERDELYKAIKSDQTMPRRIEVLHKYLRYALTIEDFKKENPKVVPSDIKIQWKQSSIVTQKYSERMFTVDYFSVEVLHLIWMNAVLLLNHSFQLYEATDFEGAVANLRECAGIFHYLSADRLRVASGESVPYEFQPIVFNSLKLLALGQAYSLIAARGEKNGMGPSPLAKLCYAISATFSSSLEQLDGNLMKPNDVIHQQYINWLRGVKAYYHALAAIYFAQFYVSKEAYGKAIGLIRLAISDIENLLTLDKFNCRLNDVATEVLNHIKELDKEWVSTNFTVYSEYVPSADEADLIITQSVTSMPNLPQPIQFNLPEPMPYTPKKLDSTDEKPKQ